jgi:hypothetical protein
MNTVWPTVNMSALELKERGRQQLGPSVVDQVGV